MDDDAAKIGKDIVDPGTALGSGLTPAAAADLGLRPGTPVGASLIDAHAGGLATIGAQGADGVPASLLDRLAYIMGTSACIMATTEQPRFVPGVWGPYFSAMVPGLWLNEGGQSASGAAIDHLLQSHPAHAEAVEAAQKAGLAPIDFLERRVTQRFDRAGDAARLAQHLHVLPDFLGNRSPHADPQARAVIAGLDLDSGLESLVRVFVAGLCGLAYGLADVIDALRPHDIPSRMIVISGGASHSALVRQIIADTTGVPVALPTTAEPVLLGAAMLGAVAGRTFPTVDAAIQSMSRLGAVTRPSAAMADFHAAKRKVHALLREVDRGSRLVMAATAQF
jgi:D-ribulokinase